MKKLSCILPVLNEEFFMPLYLESVLGFVDELVIIDTGSTDNTLDIIRSYMDSSGVIKLFDKEFGHGDKRYGWNEGVVKNFALSQTTGDFVMSLDADELVSDSFVYKKEEFMNSQYNSFAFNMVNFWDTVDKIRVNTPDDPHWDGYVQKMWRKGTFEFQNILNHAGFIWSKPMLHTDEVTLFHYHYALGKIFKENDNRQGEMRVDDSGEINMYAVDKNIKTDSFKGKHPFIMRKFLETMENNK